MRIAKPFSRPMATWLAQMEAVAPFDIVHQTKPLSSSCRFGTKVSSLADSLVISSPVVKWTRFSAWEPMSPMHPARPLRAGSVRHKACLLAGSGASASQSWIYSAAMRRMSPRSPWRIISRIWRTSG
ncbi:MAG: hypothetical protein LUE17_12030 [Planctomycetaceae bacterium]|nr:hypothetical protein [Planctomycetaceae bacterium]